MLSRALIHSNDQPAGPMTHMPDWGLCQHTPHLKSLEDKESHCLSYLWIKELCCWEHKPYLAWGKTLSTGICNGTSHRDECVLCTPGWEGTTQSQYVCCEPDILKYIIPRVKHAPLEREEKLGVLLAPNYLFTQTVLLLQPKCTVYIARSIS